MMKVFSSGDGFTQSVLPSSLAGRWYPGNSGSLRRMIESGLAALPAAKASSTAVNLLILPHAGYVYSLSCALYGIREIQGQDFSRVIVLAPSHRQHLPNQICAAQAAAIETPLGESKLDQEAAGEIDRLFRLKFSDDIHLGEHAAQIQYPLIQYALPQAKILPLIVGTMQVEPLRAAAKAIKSAWDANTLLLISSDFTHYGDNFGYRPFANRHQEQVRKMDLQAFALLQKQEPDAFMDFLAKSGATICGHYALALMLYMLDADAGLRLLHYCNSADNPRDNNFVCYLAAAGYLPRE
ncbi:MAG: AmmeMemoRadiSam system protein B [Oligosphaeraceae bacterium]|nr:AmmeMemoRadiSam system protein B [Oligosphaeraceae bacterium]